MIGEELFLRPLFPDSTIPLSIIPIYRSANLKLFSVLNRLNGLNGESHGQPQP